MSHAVDSVVYEYSKAILKYPKMASAHEGYAILLEEVEELWDEVKKNPATRTKKKMEEEAIQVAAMAIRFIHDICQ